MYNIFVWKIEKLLNAIFQRMFLFCFLLVLFLLLSNKSLYVMFSTYISYWNTSQYKCIIHFSCRKTVSCTSEKTLKIYLKQTIFIYSLSFCFFACYRFVSTSRPGTHKRGTQDPGPTLHLAPFPEHSHLYNSYMSYERFHAEKQFRSKKYLLKMTPSRAKLRLKSTLQKRKF